MPVRGIERVRSNYKRTVQRIAQPVSEGAVYAVLLAGRNAADAMTPQDTGTLLNSGYAPQIKIERGKVTGTVGYTASYAFAVHEAPGLYVGQSKPRDPSNPSRGDYWDPNAGPRFLVDGFDIIKPTIAAILRAHYRA